MDANPVTGTQGAKKQRIAFVLPDMGAGGAERVALTIIRDLLARGHPVDLVVARAQGELLDLVPAGVELVDLSAPRLSRALFPLVRYLRRRRPNALQVSMWPLTVIAIVARMLARIPTRIVVSDHVALSQQYGNSLRTLQLLKLTVRIFYPLANARVLVSAGAADDLAAISGIPRSEFKVIYNPVPDPETGQAKANVEAMWGNGGARIITAGTLKPQKNQRLLIDAFARLRSHRRAKLIIVGDGPLRAELEEHSDRSGVGADVIFTGYAPKPSEYLASADLFVLSSDFEGFGNVLVEAMRLGVPVVSTDCPSGPREILDGGRFGRLVPCGDAEALAQAMEASLDDPATADALKARAEELSGQKSIDRYVDLLLGLPPSQPPAAR